MPTHRSVRRRILAGLLTTLVAGVATAQANTDFPQKPVTLVVPFAAGGSLDITARIIGERLKDELGQPVLITNRPGAGSAVGARAVAAAAADGHTLFFTSGSAFGFLHLLVPNMELRLENFVPIAAVAVNPSVVVASMKMPVQNLADLANHPNPGTINFCSTGMGGLNHLQLEMFRRAATAKGGKPYAVTHVPYNGLAPALTGIRDGSANACMLPYAGLVKNMHERELRILAVQSKNRLPWLPNVPTASQAGFPELENNDSFVNVAAPRGTPQPVIAKLEAALQKTLQDPTVLKKLNELEVQPVFMGSRETQAWLENDVRKYGTIIREAGVVVN
jgi:tripartite-type tricarboxylate transporter receptor subunit TctC